MESRSGTATLRTLALALLLMLGLSPSLVASQSTPATDGAASTEATPEPHTGPLFVLRPADDVDGAYFTLEAEPGSTHTLTAVLGNAGTGPLELYTYVGDAFTLVNGGFGVREEDEPRTEASTWIEYEAGPLEFAPGEGIERSFTVTVPEDAEPGEYIAGIVLQTAEPVEIEGSTMFDQLVRKSVAVFITVPGEVTPGVEVGTPEIQGNVAGQRIVVPVNNTGNVLLKPTGEVVLTDAAGNEAFKQPFAMGSVYAGMQTTLEVPLPPALPEGAYQVSVDMTDPVTELRANAPETVIALSHDAQVEAPLEITTAQVTPMPSADEVQFAAVSVSVTNRDAPMEGVRVVLDVARNGEPVEEFVLASSVTLQQGETVIEQRYLPLEGWTSGEWTFTVTLETLDPQTNAEATLLEVPVETPIMIAD
jgi:hypothetical protein